MSYLEANRGKGMYFSPSTDQARGSSVLDGPEKINSQIPTLADLIWQTNEILKSTCSEPNDNSNNLDKQISEIIDGMGEDKNRLLWGTVKFMLVKAAERSLLILNSPELTDTITEIGSMTLDELIEEAKKDD
jgi:hypothetical protein